MDIKNSINIIINDIKEIDKIVKNFENYSNVPRIEIDITLSKVRNLYDNLLLLRDVSLEIQPKKVKIPEPDIPKEVNIETHTEEISLKSDKNDTEEPEVKPSEEKKKAKIQVEDSLFIEKQQDPPKIINKGTTKKKVKEKTEPEIIAEKFQKSKQFINETLAKEKNHKDISTKMQSKPISDISSSIGLNDKFLFIKELFDGNNETYLQTIDYLNKAVELDPTIKYLEGKFDWDMDDPTVQKLTDLIKRKLITNLNE